MTPRTRTLQRVLYMLDSADVPLSLVFMCDSISAMAGNGHARTADKHFSFSVGE